MNSHNTSEPEYECLSDVMSEIRDALVLDVARYMSRIPYDEQNMLEPAPVGVYAHGALEPYLLFGMQHLYYSYSKYSTGQAPDIVSFETFIQTKEPVVNQHGKVVCQNPHHFRNYFKPECDFNYSAIHLAAATAWDTVRALHPAPNHWTKIPQAWLDVSYWVRPECYREHFLEKSFSPAFGDLPGLIERIYQFIGRDRYSAYGIHLQNASLIIEKGNDFRVLHYYEQIFKAREEEHVLKYGF